MGKSYYYLQVMYECEWKEKKNKNPDIRRFLEQFSEEQDNESRSARMETSQADILKMIEEEKLFGLVRCDVSVPEHLKERFEEWSPILKNEEVSLNILHFEHNLYERLL